MADRSLDLVLYGATGFTGRLVARHLAARTAGTDLRWALAGRSRPKLEAVAEAIGLPDLPLVVADATDPASLDAMARDARVVCTTVGPYAAHGSDVVRACAVHGTDYCDLTGEVQWIRRMIDAHQGTAETTGARIVHTCGFDSIPSDLGTWVAQGELHARHGTYARRVTFGLRSARGGASGGTLASVIGVVEEAASDPAAREVLLDPDALHPDPSRRGRTRPDPVLPARSRELGSWTGPFAMAVVNTRVVRRTNALLGSPWGEDFTYTEHVMTGDGPLGAVKAAAVAAATGLGAGALAIGPVRRLAERVLPEAGEGPSERAQERGHFSAVVHAAHPTDRSRDVVVDVHGDRDPGYGSTARMLGEAALCLAAGEVEVPGGHWTPASAMGQALVDRLQAHAGVTFTPR